MSWNTFLSSIRAANPNLTSEVAYYFDEIEKEKPYIYWCPNTGKKYEPLVLDHPVPLNPLNGLLYQPYRLETLERKHKKILLWINDAVTQKWYLPEHHQIDLCLRPSILAHVQIKLVQHLQQPLENQSSNNELVDFGVFEVCKTNGLTQARDADTYIVFISMVKSAEMIKQVFAKHKLHIHVAALVDSDLRKADESAESIFKLLKDHEPQVGHWKYLIAPRDTRLPGWHIPELSRDELSQRTHRGVQVDGWGDDALWLWNRNPD